MEKYEMAFLYGTFIGLILLTNAIGKIINEIKLHEEHFKRVIDILKPLSDRLESSEERFDLIAQITKDLNRADVAQLKLIEKLENEMSEIKVNVGNMADKELNENILNKELKQ
jgi:S-adenosylmethionine synthetase